MKNKFKDYKFWVGLIASVVVLIATLGTIFNFSVDIVAISTISATVLGILIALGVISKTNDDQDSSIKDDILNEINYQQGTTSAQNTDDIFSNQTKDEKQEASNSQTKNNKQNNQ